jgi:hypothetical protein
MSDDKQERDQLAEPKIEASRNDRYSSWNDKRNQSKNMKGWRFHLRFEAKHFIWPIFKWAINHFLWPWPFWLLAALYFGYLAVRKFFSI